MQSVSVALLLFVRRADNWSLHSGGAIEEEGYGQLLRMSEGSEGASYRAK